MTRNRRLIAGLVLGLITLTLALSACVPREEPAGSTLNLVIVIDGLRPDYITPEHMPNLHALGERGIFAERHTAAFPTVTRVNSASISTGSYPTRHGLMHNTMFLAQMSDEPFSTGGARQLRRLARFAGGHPLTAPSLAELLEERGKSLFVTGSGGSGNALLQSPTPGAGRGIWTAQGFFVPADAREAAVEAVGELVGDNPGRTAWAFDAYLHKASSDDPPDAVIMWINEPDGAGHRHGVGAPRTLRSIANVDRHIGRLIAAHEEKGLTERVNIFVTTDHGFSTATGGFSVSRALADSGIREDELTIVGGMVFLDRRDDAALLGKVVEALQRDGHTGNVYTRPAASGSGEGVIAGTLSTAAIQWEHERAADVLATPAWSDEVNTFGFPGATTRGGRAGHGTDSPYDLRIRLVAAGPDIKRGLVSQVPSGNVDLAPTVLHLLGVEPPPGMSGRVLHELLRDGPAPADVPVREHTHRAVVTFDDGFHYQAELDTLQVGSTVYLRGARTQRREPER